MSESLTTMLMLGHMMGDTALAEAKVERQRVTFAATVARLTPTALHAMLEAIAAEHVKRYGDDDEGAPLAPPRRRLRHRPASRREEAGPVNLTPRQRRILEMRARSMTNAAIAHAEGVSLAMVKREIEAILGRNGYGTVEEAIAKELVPILVEEHVRSRAPRKRRRPTQADTLGLA